MVIKLATVPSQVCLLRTQSSHVVLHLALHQRCIVNPSTPCNTLFTTLHTTLQLHLSTGPASRPGDLPAMSAFDLLLAWLPRLPLGCSPAHTPVITNSMGMFVSTAEFQLCGGCHLQSRVR